MAERTVKRITRTGTPSGSSEFPFTYDMIPNLNGKGAAVVQEYRNHAWETYKTLPMPHTQLEPWRRTDLKRLEAGSFRFPAPSAHLDLAPVPEQLLAPLVDDQHGGQITLLPGGVTVELDEALTRKGVILPTTPPPNKNTPKSSQKSWAKSSPWMKANFPP